MGLLRGKRILLGVGGGIAAYKTPELVRRLLDAGADVHVQLTKAGGRFVSSLSLEVVSQHPVGGDLWSTDGNSRIVHTDAGQDADLIVLAPATANLIGRIAHGLADDLLTTTVMACGTPVLVAPSMNTDMLANPLVQANIQTLNALPRYTVLQPDVGLLACGVTGPGRLPDPRVLIEAAAAVLIPDSLAGVRVVVSAGPTHEPVDPVRFLTNRSTGTMGFELARELAARGATVTLVAGPVDLPTPVGVASRVDVASAENMLLAVQLAADHADALIMAAAVADYRPSEPSATKIAKEDGDRSLLLERTSDILREIAARPDRGGLRLVGFAAETHDVEARARRKLQSKGLDAIVANDVSTPGIGFGRGDNAGVVWTTDDRVEIARCPKPEFAARVVDALEPILRGEGHSEDPHSQDPHSQDPHSQDPHRGEGPQ